MKHILVTLLIMIYCGTIVAQKPMEADSTYLVQDSVLIPTRSGIDISAIIVRKKGVVTPLPATLFYTTYDQGVGDAYFGKIAADRDYVGLVVYARGIRTDLKDYAPYEHEGTDVYDIIDWISKQSWCNGKVGMFGGSYTGFAQWAAIKNMHPALKTIVPQVAVMPGFDAPMENNVPYGNILSWANDNIYKNKPYDRGLVFDWFNGGTSFRSLDSLGGQVNPIFQKWLRHPGYDAYWQSMVPTPKEYGSINIPILSTTGYYDGSQLGAMQYYKRHLEANKNAEHYFVIGPYDHYGAQSRAQKNLMGYEIDSVANINMRILAFQWLDYILKDKDKPELLKDKFNYQVMGTNEWRHASSMDKINNDTLTFYLDHRTLTTLKPKKKSFESQTVDFKDRDQQNNYYTPEIVFDSLDASNGLIYASEPFDYDLSINGSFVGNISTMINKKDMDISLALYEQMADGRYFFLTRYIGRASFAKGPTKRHLLVPNKKAQIPLVYTRFVSRKLNKGSRLVILLNINKHPFEIINYGSGKAVADETILDADQPLKIKWYNDSFIKVPVWKE